MEKAKTMRMNVLSLYVFIAFSGNLFGQYGDSTDLIFRDDVIHRYELEFAVEDWAEALAVNKEINDEAYMPGLMRYIAPEGDTIVLDEIGVRYKGNSSYTLAVRLNNPKKSLKFHFDAYVDDQRFFECERLNFNNCIEDPSYMREKISYDIIRNYMAAPRVAYATISANGTPIGVFAQVEQVDDHFLDRNFTDGDGNLFKAGDDGAVLDYKGVNKDNYTEAYELKTNEEEDDWTSFISMLLHLNESSDEAFVAEAGSCLDLDKAIRHFAWTMVLSHFDSYTGSGRNYYLYDDPDSDRFVIIPWDLNMSFGQFPGWDPITNDILDIPNLEQRPLNRRIIDNDSLRSVYLQYMIELITGPANLDSISAEADRLKLVINEAIENEPDTSRFYTYEQFLTNVDSNVVIQDGMNVTTIYGIKSFAAQRNAELLRQIEAGVSFRSRERRSVGGMLQCRYTVSNAAVTVRYSVGNSNQPVRITIFNSRGRVAGRLFPGKYRGTIRWKADDAAQGVYFVVMTSADEQFTDQVTIFK